MKRVISILLIFVLAFSLAACVYEEEPELVDPVNFYYLRVQDPENLYHGTADSVVLAEQREAFGVRDFLTVLLERYLSGPTSEGLVSPFPAGTKLKAWELSGNMLTLTLSNEIAQLSGMDLTLACACLTVTCLELTDAEAVQIRAESATFGSKASITMTRNDLVLLDEGFVATEPTEN